MLHIYTHGSPNGHKVTIALEELGLPYEVKPVNVFAGEGQMPAFLALNPAGKIPVLHDTEHELVLSESNAILIYLADLAGRLLPASGRERTRAMELLFLQASLQGPMFGQRSHFSLFGPEVVPYGIERYEQQGDNFDALAERLLACHPYFLGASYSVVDIALFGWYHAAQRAGFAFTQHRALSGWYERVAARPAVQRGVTIPSGLPPASPTSGCKRRRSP
ncbi:MAG: Glutathione S-transferase [Myxococcaceae bacterium]|nr:Glutathione S-transferase [Myxococcaceae bacterium]